MGINGLRLILDAESLGFQADHKDSCGITRNISNEIEARRGLYGGKVLFFSLIAAI